MNDAATQLALSDGDIAQTGGTPAVVTARRVSYWYGDVLGVNDVSLDIGPGVTGLLGPNGAGKSTLLKILSGQLKPKGGAAGLEDDAIWNNPAARSRIGLVPEHDGFYEEMTGREFVAYLTRLHGYGPARADDLAEDAIETVGLVEEQHRTISSYSKGMRQRIKFAQALAHDPEVVFLDEPLDGTDPVGRHALIELVQELGEAGKTVVVSSHVLEEVERMTSEIILIHEGRVLADGNIYEIRELIDEHPHAIIVDSPEPRTFARHLIEHDDIRKIEFEAPGLRLETDDPNACYSRIPELALEEGLTLNGMTSPDNDLSSVFRYLVE